jgi:anti-anti-sigma regulatory factor
VDAAAIGALRAAQEVLRGHGGRLVLTGASEHVELALRGAGLSGVGAVHFSLEKALADLQGSQ